MPREHWVMWQGARWRLSALAAEHHIARITLFDRLAAGMSIEEALERRPMTCTVAARHGKRRSPWSRYMNHKTKT